MLKGAVKSERFTAFFLNFALEQYSRKGLI